MNDSLYQDNMPSQPIINSMTSDGRIPCPFCGKLYKSVNIHISRAHQKEHRDNIANKLPKEVPICIIHSDESNADDHDAMILHSTAQMGTNYEEELKQWCALFSTNITLEDFENKVANFTVFLAKSIDYLPGPKHPARKHYEARKQRKENTLSKNYLKSTNPIRSSNKARQKRREKFIYEKTQFDFYNQRRKAVRTVLHNNSPTSKINKNIVFKKFSERFSNPNNRIRSEYIPRIDDSESLFLNELYDAKISADEVMTAMKAIKIDTAPGPDRVLMRAVKSKTVAGILALIYSVISDTAFVPSCLKEARTILIHKGGDVNDPDNFRPITICSILRRILERILNARLQRFITFNSNQRGFTSSPGTHINVALLDCILKKIKAEKGCVTAVFLDISKAFDNVGHNHIQKTLENSSLPSQLQNVIIELQKGNKTKIETGDQHTDPIELNRGVMQGAPLSPTLYNMATDFILDELSEDTLSQKYGFQLLDRMKKITVLGFADDTVIIAKNREDATTLTSMAIQRFQEIGLSLNLHKSVCLNIVHGYLDDTPLLFNANCEIRSLHKHEKIRYLGVDFSDNLFLDEGKIGNDLKEKLNLLVGSPLLKSEQKFLVINQFILPTLVYSFQTASTLKIKKSFLFSIDKIIKSSVKEILHLPVDTPDAMLYSPKKFKGLGVYKAQWEALIQQFNACSILEKTDNDYISSFRNLRDEKASFLVELGFDEAKDMIDKKPSDIRGQLRLQEFTKWSALRTHGKGIELFSECPPANSWIINLHGLTSSEWRDAIKLHGNVAPVRALHGRSQDNTHCRHCNEIETLPHVLGSCPFGDLLRNHRHHQIRTKIATALKTYNNFEVHEEVHCLAANGSSRRIDMIAIDRTLRTGYIVDPTIRFETSVDQPEEVNSEKRTIYEPTIDYFKNMYDLDDITVTGLLIGSRGTITSFFQNFCKSFNIPQSVYKDIGLLSLKTSIQILRNHLYN